MRPRTKSSLLWGLVGGMGFLVLVQGYELVGELGITLGAKAGVALLVGAVTVSVAYAVEGRLGGTSDGETVDGGRREGEDESGAGKGRI